MVNQDTSIIPHGLYCCNDDIVCPHFQVGKVSFCLLLNTPVKSADFKKVCFLNMTMPDDDDITVINEGF